MNPVASGHDLFVFVSKYIVLSSNFWSRHRKQIGSLILKRKRNIANWFLLIMPTVMMSHDEFCLFLKVFVNELSFLVEKINAWLEKI